MMMTPVRLYLGVLPPLHVVQRESIKALNRTSCRAVGLVLFAQQAASCGLAYALAPTMLRRTKTFVPTQPFNPPLHPYKVDFPLRSSARVFLDSTVV